MNLIPRALYFLAFIVVLSSCSKSTKETANSSPAPSASMSVEAVTIHPTLFSSQIVTTANLLANEQIEIKAPISGQVLNIYFNEGAYVSKGAPIVHIDDRSWRAQKEGLEAELIAAESSLKRKRSLLEIEGSTQEEIETSVSNVESLKARIKELDVNINLANVKAPFSGYIGMRDFSVGAYLSAGNTISTLTSISKLKVDFNLPQAHQRHISKGKSINVIVNKDTLEAEIYAINPLINSSSRTINVRALLVPPKEVTLMPGTYAEISLLTGDNDQALMVPSQAIVPEIDKQTVYVYKSGKVKRNVIEMGLSTDDKTQVLSGISAGDTLLTTGLLRIKEGMSVQLQSVN